MGRSKPERLTPEILEDKSKRKQEVVSPELIEVEIRSLSQSSKTNRIDTSFLDKVAQSTKRNECDELKINTSISSLQQPCLRQIPSSHTSRSNK